MARWALTVSSVLWLLLFWTLRLSNNAEALRAHVSHVTPLDVGLVLSLAIALALECALRWGRPDGRVFPFALLLAVSLWSGLMYPADASEVTFSGDTQSYIQHLPYRGSVYPGFISLMVDSRVLNALRDAPPGQYAFPEAFLALVKTQWLLLTLGFAAVATLLYREHVLAPLVVVCGLFGVELIFGFHLLGNVRESIRSVLSEGLAYPWLALLIAITIHVVRDGRRQLPWLIALGLWSAAGFEIAPRLVVFGLLAALPLRRDASNPVWRGAGALARAVPVLIFIAMYLVQCAITQRQYGVFATAPFNGYATVALAISYSDPADAARLSNPVLRRIVEETPRQGLDRAAVRRTTNMVVGRPVGDAEANRMFAEITGTLLWQPHVPIRWARSAAGQFVAVLRQSRLWAHGCAIALILALAWRHRSEGMTVCLGLLALNYLNLIFCIAVQDPLPRYFCTSWFLWPFIFAFVGAELADRAARGIAPP